MLVLFLMTRRGQAGRQGVGGAPLGRLVLGPRLCSTTPIVNTIYK